MSTAAAGLMDLPVRYVALRGGRLAYIDAGVGEPVVLLHGFGDQFVTWRHQVDVLSARARVIAVDLPGHGYSDKPRIEYTPAFYVSAVRETLEALGIRQATLVGSSMGGAIALGVAGRHPELVERLVLIGPTSPGAEPRGRVDAALFRLARWPAVAARLLAQPMRWSVRAALRDVVADPRLITPALVDHYLAMARREGFAWAHVSTATHWREWTDFRPRMGALRLPVLIVWGESDRVHPIRQSMLLRTLMPQARFVPLSCGHLPHVECPGEVNEALRQFLERNV